MGCFTSGHAQTSENRRSKLMFQQSKLVMGDTVGHWRLVAKGLNVHRIEPSIAPEMNGLGR